MRTSEPNTPNFIPRYSPIRSPTGSSASRSSITPCSIADWHRTWRTAGANSSSRVPDLLTTDWPPLSTEKWIKSSSSAPDSTPPPTAAATTCDFSKSTAPTPRPGNSACSSQATIPVPDTVTFVPIDFEQTTLLEERDAPVGAFDWRRHATVYGPFASEAATDEHLTIHHANPGGMTVTRYEPGFQPDEILTELLTHAIPPLSARIRRR